MVYKEENCSGRISRAKERPFEKEYRTYLSKPGSSTLSYEDWLKTYYYSYWVVLMSNNGQPP